MNKIKKISVPQVVLAIIIPVAFILIALILRSYFSENIIPSDYPNVQPDEWAQSFFKRFVVFSVICIIVNAAIVPYFVAYTKFNKKSNWLYFFITNIVFMVMGPIWMTWCLPADMYGTFIVWFIFIAEYLITYIASTAYAPIGFFPFKSTKIRKK